MKQKAVIKLAFKKAKHRLTALKFAAGAHKSCSKIESIGWKKNEEDVIEIVGNGVDFIKLVKSLRKKFLGAEIISLTAVVAGEKPSVALPPLPPPYWQVSPWCPYGYHGDFSLDEPYHTTRCSIM